MRLKDFVKYFLQCLFLPFRKVQFFQNVLRKGYIGNYKLRDLLAHRPKSSDALTIKIVKNDGINFELDISNYNDWRVYYRVFDKSMDYLLSTIKSEACIIDVGANLGYYTLNFAKVAPNGKVFAFEPHPLNLNKLKKNIALNPFTNITIHDMAVGKENGRLCLEVAEKNNLGTSRVVLDKSRKQDIQVITLDNFIKGQNISEINVLKIDVEGFEMDVLQGAVEVIREHKPILFVELCDKHLRNYGSSALDMIEYLRSLKYYKIQDANTKKNINRINLDNCQLDIICFP
ncbi:MAG: FkbM family methyltransferase [Saprospiraceae bacterium]